MTEPWADLQTSYTRELAKRIWRNRLRYRVAVMLPKNFRPKSLEYVHEEIYVRPDQLAAIGEGARIYGCTESNFVTALLELELDEEENSGAKVPVIGELLLCLFLPPERQKERLGCFEERYNDWKSKFGARIARRMYYFHSLCSIGAIIKIVTLGFVVDKIYRFIKGSY